VFIEEKLDKIGATPQKLLRIIAQDTSISTPLGATFNSPRELQAI
jgi:hypothetical protein